jgi:hypothetical protein
MNIYAKIAIVAVFSVWGGVGMAQSPTVTIDRIVAGGEVTGHVQSVNPKELSSYKVLLYVHTDQWYIHPYAGQGEGKSWASVSEKGSWSLSTVQREFPADRVAALLVVKDYPEPNRVTSLTNIPAKAVIVRVLQGTSDYGKL